MALSLRDVMARPSDSEAMELLMDEYTKYCVGRLDDGGDMSGDEEDQGSNGTFYGLPVVDGAFDVRLLCRVDFPRTWVVPTGTIPFSYYENTPSHGSGIGGMESLVDYSRIRCIVCARSELLKPPGDTPLPQKVLAVWPEAQKKHEEQQQCHAPFPVAQTTLYWPAYITRVVGVFDDSLLDGSPSSYAQLREYEDFHDILVYALRTPMRLCVDVTFCIDETSEAHRLTIAPALRYPGGGSGGSTGKCASDNDEEVMQHSELVCTMMKGDRSRHCIVCSEAQCPQLVPDVMPQVLSIRNFSYVAATGKRRQCGPLAGSRICRSVVHRSKQEKKNSGATVGKVGENSKLETHQDAGIPHEAATQRCRNTPASGGSGASLSKVKLSRNTLSHSPITLLDMLAGPICQTQQFVFLRPTAKVAVKAQRAAIEELWTLWQRLRQTLLKTLRADESLLPTTLNVQLPDENTHESPYLEVNPAIDDCFLRLPPSVGTRNVLADDAVHHCLPILQGHHVGPSRFNAQWNLVPPMVPHMSEHHTSVETLGQRGDSGRRSLADREMPPSRFRTHDPDGDVAHRCRSGSWDEGGTKAGLVGGPSGVQSRFGSVNATLLLTSPCRSSVRSGNSAVFTSPVKGLGVSPRIQPRQQQEWGKAKTVQISPNTPYLITMRDDGVPKHAEGRRLQNLFLEMDGKGKKSGGSKGSISSRNNNTNSSTTRNRNSGESIANTEGHLAMTGTNSEGAQGETVLQQPKPHEEFWSLRRSRRMESPETVLSAFTPAQQRYSASQEEENGIDGDKNKKQAFDSPEIEPLALPPRLQRQKEEEEKIARASRSLTQSASTRVASTSKYFNTYLPSSISYEETMQQHRPRCRGNCSMDFESSNRFVITSWREGCLEINVDDKLLLPSALDEEMYEDRAKML